MLVEITDTVIKRRCIRGPMHPNLCSRWNSGYRYHVWEPFIVIYHRECTFDFGIQVCKFFTTDHFTHFFPIPMKLFFKWRSSKDSIRIVPKADKICNLPKEPSGRDDLELFEEILNASINLSLTFFSRATANWRCSKFSPYSFVESPPDVSLC